MPLDTTNAKNPMLGAITPDRMQMHSGDPGASGLNNQLGSKTACVFAAASGGSRALNAAVDFTGLGSNQSCPWVSIWNNNGGSPLFLGRAQISSGDTSANASGEFRVTTATTITLSDS